MPQFSGDQGVAQVRLVTLFQGAHRVSHDIYGTYSSRRMKPRKLVVFLEFLKAALPDEF